MYQKTHISKTSVYRILKTLVHRGYVAQAQNGLYRLVSRPRRLRFGFAVQSAELPFSMAVTESVTAAAAASGVELLVLDNKFDAAIAVKNAEEFVARRVDLVLEFQAEEARAPRIANIFKKADIPLVAIDVPHPNATYFGVDNFECGYEAGVLLAQHAHRAMERPRRRSAGRGICRGGQLCAEPHHRRIRRSARAVADLAPQSCCSSWKGAACASQAGLAVAEFLRGRRRGERILVAAATDSSALGVLDAAREAGRESDFAIVGQDCIPEALDEMQIGQERADRQHLARGGDLWAATDPTGNFASARLHGATVQLCAAPAVTAETLSAVSEKRGLPSVWKSEQS